MVPSLNTDFLTRLRTLRTTLDERARANSGDLQGLYRDRADQVSAWIDDFERGHRIEVTTIEPAVREFERMCGIGQ